MARVHDRNLTARERRARRIRKKISGTPERPRLSVYKSNKHIYAQVIDDTVGKTLAFASTLSKEIREKVAEATKSEAARLVGQLVAEKAKAAQVTRVVFDRNGFPYHGRLAVLADAAREAGLEF
ncbi:MAG: 50S ribosomal protein L18 [Pseudomonadota bacterium]|nr:MAG: 50S ribosomal protein L18 [Pseudomonadota bacterium]